MGCEEVNFSGTGSPNISYVGANNEIKWNYPVAAFNNWNYMLNDREFTYNVNLSFKNGF